MNNRSRDTARWTGAEAYERYMGRWSRTVGRGFLVWLDPGPGLRWLDVGCGTGALTSEILRGEKSPPSDVWARRVAGVRGARAIVDA